MDWWGLTLVSVDWMKKVHREESTGVYFSVVQTLQAKNVVNGLNGLCGPKALQSSISNAEENAAKKTSVLNH